MTYCKHLVKKYRQKKNIEGRGQGQRGSAHTIEQQQTHIRGDGIAYTIKEGAGLTVHIHCETIGGRQPSYSLTRGVYGGA